MAPSTCAEATFRVWVPASIGTPPSMVTGAWPSVVATDAPIERSGTATRSIGREEREASPVRVVRPWRVVAAPIRRRIKVPEFSQSSATSSVPGSAAFSLVPPPRTR